MAFFPVESTLLYVQSHRCFPVCRFSPLRHPNQFLMELLHDSMESAEHEQVFQAVELIARRGGL